jgi:hypothetical protein
MATGSFPQGNILQFSSGTLRVYGGNPYQFILTYPIGYSGSVPRPSTPTGSAAPSSGSIIPTVGQIWPRGNRTVV